MVFQFHHAFKALALAAFALFFLKLHTSGTVTKYVNPDYALLSLGAAYAFFFFGFIQLFRLWRRKNKHPLSSHSACCQPPPSKSSGSKIISYCILIFPLLTGFFLPPQTLNASIAAKKGAGLFTQKKAAISDQLPPDHQELVVNRKEIQQTEYNRRMSHLEKERTINMTNDVFEPYYGRIQADPEKYAGRMIKMSGFVFEEDKLPDNQLVLSRFLITHCVADASHIGFLTEFDKAPGVKQDTWLEINGTIALTRYNGVEMPIVQITSWKKITEPAEPYVYPLYIKIA